MGRRNQDQSAVGNIGEEARQRRRIRDPLANISEETATQRLMRMGVVSVLRPTQTAAFNANELFEGEVSDDILNQFQESINWTDDYLV